MVQVTVMEALSNKKLFRKRIDSRREFVQRYLTRASTAKDPLHKEEGGSVGAISRALQAIQDLEENYIATCRAIHSANAENELTIGNQTRTIEGWLVWKDVVAPKYEQFLEHLTTSVGRARDPQLLQQVRRQFQSATEAGEDVTLDVNIDEAWLSAELENVRSLRERVDGRLALANATIMVEVPSAGE